MTRKELEKLELVSINEEIPPLTSIYIIVSRKKHYSGFKMYEVYGVRNVKGDIVWAKKLTNSCDVIHFREKYEYGSMIKGFDIDSLECNVIHLFGAYFKVDGIGFSDFYITSLKGCEE